MMPMLFTTALASIQYSLVMARTVRLIICIGWHLAEHTDRGSDIEGDAITTIEPKVDISPFTTYGYCYVPRAMPTVERITHSSPSPFGRLGGFKALKAPFILSANTHTKPSRCQPYT